MKTCASCGRAIRGKIVQKARRLSVKSGCPNPAPRTWRQGEKPVKYSYTGVPYGMEVIVADPFAWREQLETILTRPDVAPGDLGNAQGYWATAHERAAALLEFLSVYEMGSIGAHRNA